MSRPGPDPAKVMRMATADDDDDDDMSGRRKKELLAEGGRLQPVVIIGKSGLSPGVVDDAAGQLKARGLIKVKILLKMDRGEVAALAGEMADRTGAALLQVKGRTFLLYRKGKGR